MAQKLRVGVIIGKFQPLLKGQVEHLFKPAILNSDLVVVLLGSSGTARTCYNPFTNEDRIEMIKEAIADKSPIPFLYEPIRDFLYSETPVDWITQCQSKIKNAVDKYCDEVLKSKNQTIEVTLYGAENFEQEKEYLGWYPNWKVSIAKINEVNQSQDILEAVWDGSPKLASFGDLLVPSTYEYLIKIAERIWAKSIHPSEDRFEKFRLEHLYLKDYKARTQTGKYPTIFQTVDNVVYYKGYILLVKRKSQPGAGTWALAGGFLNADESCRDGAVRELQEETGLKVKPEWFVSRETFDHPKRSLRGRTITNAFLWKIPDHRQVPQITAGSDAAKAKWFPLAEVLENMPEQIFEDHLDVILTLIKRL